MLGDELPRTEWHDPAPMDYFVMRKWAIEFASLIADLRWRVGGADFQCAFCGTTNQDHGVINDGATCPAAVARAFLVEMAIEVTASSGPI